MVLLFCHNWRFCASFCVGTVVRYDWNEVRDRWSDDYVSRPVGSFSVSSELNVWFWQFGKFVIFSNSRFVWNFFRLENEHLNNCGKFRAVRDISIAPIDSSDQALILRMMDDDEGVVNRFDKGSRPKPRKSKDPERRALLTPSTNSIRNSFHDLSIIDMSGINK